MGQSVQTTLARSVSIIGTGLHSGQLVRLTVAPAPVGHGVAFCRADVSGRPVLPARWDHVLEWPLNTRLVNADGVTVSTIEHLMAALAGLGITNALCTLDGPEVPILDGSSAPFVRALLRGGRREQDAPLRVIRVLRPVSVGNAEVGARLEPSARVEMAFDIDFADAAIGRQSLTLDLANGAFLRHLSDSRTFCRQADVDRMHAQGLALGGTYDNAVVVDGDAVLSPGGFRHENEAVRHKMLDALGDLYTAGAPILGRYVGHRAGHAVTNRLLHALFAQPDAWTWQTVDPTLARRLPGSDLTAADLGAVA